MSRQRRNLQQIVAVAPAALGVISSGEYKVDGTRRDKKPLWLIYVGPAPAPQPAEAQRIYELRFGIEHSLRFMKREVSLAGAQCNGAQAPDRIALWVELVASVPYTATPLVGRAV